MSAAGRIDAYRIGYSRWFRLAARGRLWRDGRSPFMPITGSLRHRTPDRWRRSWQAEWDGCQRAVRAWTRRGVIRKARRQW